MVAASFDELLAGVNVANELGAMTGTLTIRYRRPTPLFEEVQMEGHCTGSEGRKVFAHGEMLAGGQVTAEAEGVFVIPRG
jgi:acyl-coenzyme A thioesterase PaaI-like protein